MSELVLDLTADGAGAVRLTFTPPDGQPPIQVTRAALALDATALADLRRGEPTAAAVATLTTSVTSWILDPELSEPLKALLAAAPPMRVRVRMDRATLSTMRDLPVELVRRPEWLRPLAVHPKVRSIVHVPPGVTALPPATPRTWPLRILLVRSNPPDLGGAVPLAEPIRQAVLDASALIPEGSIVVDVLSSETGDPPVSWKAFRDQLTKATPDVLVYLGHGDLQRAFDDTEPIGLLQFESSDGAGHESIDANRIASELFQHPVRVVVLAGCLTAAQVAAMAPDMRAKFDQSLPDWLRGAEGVAQAIIDSEAPVELTVGMRARLEVVQAQMFLAAFFRSLVETAPGDVEGAVRAARDELFGDQPMPPSWSSAVVFAKGPAPVFDFLAEPPPSGLDPARLAVFQTTLDSKRSTADLFLKTVGDRAPFLVVLEAIATEEAKQLKKDTMVRPVLTSAAPGDVVIPVDLLADAKLKRLAADVRISGEGVTLTSLTADPRLAAAGFTFLHAESGTASGRFVLEHDGPATKLKAGRLCTITATVAGPTPAVHEVSVTPTSHDSPRPVWPGTDLLVVP